MKLFLGRSNTAVNIKKVVINEKDQLYSLEVNLEILSGQNKTSPNQSIFIFATTDASISKRIANNNAQILPYLNRTKTTGPPARTSLKGLLLPEEPVRSSIVYTISGLSSIRQPPAKKRSYKKPTVSFKKNLTIHKESIRELTLFAGVISRRQLRARDVTSLVSMDTLVILKDGAPQDTNLLLYKDQEHQKLWLGQSFQASDGLWYKQGSGSATTNNRLYAVIVPNTKIVFQSELDAALLQTVSNTFESLYLLNKVVNSKQAIVNNLKTKTRNYFSSFSYSKTIPHSVPISFSFNKLDFFRNNGAFSRLIKNETEMINSFELLATKILRKRVKTSRPSSRLTGMGASQDFDGVETILGGAVGYPDLFPTDNVLTVTSTDTEMRNITYGLYSYGVEFTFLDKTHEKLANIVSQPDLGLKASVTLLNNLYEEMKFSYDVYAGSFDQAYISQYTMNNTRKEIVMDAIRSYVSAIALFHRDLAKAVKSTPGALSSKLYTLAEPIANGPDGILKLSKLMLDLITQIGFHVRQRSTATQGDSAVLHTRNSRLGSGARIITIKHYFDEVVDADELTEIGFDYLTAESSPLSLATFNPFRQLTYNQLLQLQTIEGTKYDNFSVAQSDPVSLTPNYFNMRGNLLKVNSKDPNQSEINSVIATTILAANKYRNSPINLSQFNVNDNSTNASTNTLSILKNNLKVMEKENCVAEVRPYADDTTIFRAYTAPLYPASGDNYLDAAEKMSEPSPFVINKTGSISLGAFLKYTINNNSQDAYYTQIQKLNNDLLSYLVQTDYYQSNTQMTTTQVKNLTDQQVFSSNNMNLETFNLRALELSKTSPDTAAYTLSTVLLGHREKERITPQDLNYAAYISKPVSASNIPSVALKYGKVKRIQYLAGFRKVNDSVMMKEPIWITLTNNNFVNFSQTDKIILCRFTDSYTEFSKYHGVESPFYDEMFLLGPTTTAAGQASVAGDSSFSLLQQTSFGSLDNLADLDDDALNYSFSHIEGTVANSQIEHIFGPSPKKQPTTNNGNGALYTSGGDFATPSGGDYIGHYHIRLQGSTDNYIAMEGTAHKDLPHVTLRPISEKAKRILNSQSSKLANGSTAPGTSGDGTSGY